MTKKPTAAIMRRITPIATATPSTVPSGAKIFEKKAKVNVFLTWELPE